jgi:hypothetical protein
MKRVLTWALLITQETSLFKQNGVLGRHLLHHARAASLTDSKKQLRLVLAHHARDFGRIV